MEGKMNMLYTLLVELLADQIQAPPWILAPVAVVDLVAISTAPPHLPRGLVMREL
jgi:hypothetical protein